VRRMSYVRVVHCPSCGTRIQCDLVETAHWGRVYKGHCPECKQDVRVEDWADYPCRDGTVLSVSLMLKR